MAMLLFAGCDSPRDRAAARVRGSDGEKLRFESARLHTQFFAAQGKEFAPVASALWPECIGKLKPARVGLYKDGLTVALAETDGMESGLHIVPSGVNLHPKDTPTTRYERLAEGIYWYEMKQ